MKKSLKTFGVFVLLLASQTVFSQEKESMSLNATTINRNSKEKTVEYAGNVTYNSKSISFDNAKRVVLNEKTNTMKIYSPKNFKIINAKALAKPAKKETDFITYNYKENTLIL